MYTAELEQSSKVPNYQKFKFLEIYLAIGKGSKGTQKDFNLSSLYVFNFILCFIDSRVHPSIKVGTSFESFLSLIVASLTSRRGV